MKKGIIFCLFMCFCAMQVFSFKGSVKLQFVGKLKKPKDVVIKGPTCVLSKDGSLFMLPYSRFATTQLYVFDFKKLEFKQLYQYPDEAKYCYIPRNDSAFWANLSKSPLFCYPCTFSFRKFFQDINDGAVYSSVFSLRKQKQNDSAFTPIPLFFRLDTNVVKVMEYVNDSFYVYGTFGSIGKKGDTLILWSESKKEKSKERHLNGFIAYYIPRNKKVIRILEIKKISADLNKTIDEFGHSYFLNKSQAVFYCYSQTPPIIIDLNNFKHSYLKYQGKLGSIKDGNFSYSSDAKGDTIRTSLLKFIPNDGKIVLVGEKNKGKLLDNFELQEIYLQYYNKDNLNLEKEFVLEFPTQKNYQFFDCFTDPNDKSKLYFLLYTKENDLDLYCTKIE